MIELRNLTKSFDGKRNAVVGIDLEVAEGELVALVGGSGSGKTTTLKMVNRLVEPTAGTVRVAGEDVRSRPVHELRRAIGYGFQEVGLFPHLTVGENVGITPRLLGWPAARIAERVEELLALVELDPAEFRDRKPDQLSGGQRQRIGVARALAARPPVVLFDEPFGALDPLTRDRLQVSFDRIRRTLRLTGLFVTHDVVEALVLADRIAVFHEGRLEQVGTPEALIAHPATAVVRELIETPRRQTRAVAHLFGERIDA